MIRGQHIKFRENIPTIGNRVFISINIHNKIQTSRRDDIESLGYNLIFFLKGKLPWSHIKRSHDILEKKLKTSLDELCEGTPDEFKEFIKYARNMKFEEEPDYAYLNKLLLNAAEKNGIELDKVEYDWEILKKKKDNEDNNMINITKENNRDEKDNNISLNMNVNDDDNIKCEKNKGKNEEKKDNKEKINDDENKENEKDSKGEDNNSIINKDQKLNEEERNEIKEDKIEKEENAENNVDITGDKNSKEDNRENIMEKNNNNTLDNIIKETNEINDLVEKNKIED